MTYLAYLLAVILTIEQAFDCISTNLVISKGRGHEGNGLMAKWMGIAGQWWWTIKLPVVAYVWWMVTQLQPSRIMVALLVLMVLGYAWVLNNNYKLAWRKE